MELLLRMRVALKRNHVPEKDTLLMLGEACIDLKSATVLKNGETISLTAKEYQLLKKLYENRGRIVSIDELCETLWSDGAYGLESSLIVHIRHLREKVEKDPSKPQYIITVRGLGYRMEK